MSPFAGYLLGLLVLIGGLAVAAYLLNVPTTAIIVAVVLAVLAMFAWANSPSSRAAVEIHGDDAEFADARSHGVDGAQDLADATS